MGSTLALGPVEEALLARIRSTAPVTELLADALDGNAGVYDEVPQALPRDRRYPYVRVGDEARSETPFDAFGGVDAKKWGSVCHVPIRVVSRFRGNAEATGIMSAIKTALDGRPLEVDGYGSVIVQCVGTTAVPGELVAGVKTRELVSDFEITVSQRGL